MTHLKSKRDGVMLGVGAAFASVVLLWLVAAGLLTLVDFPPGRDGLAAAVVDFLFLFPGIAALAISSGLVVLFLWQGRKRTATGTVIGAVGAAVLNVVLAIGIVSAFPYVPRM